MTTQHTQQRIQQRIHDFLKSRRPDGPCLVVDLDVVRDNYHSLKAALPQADIFYAVKANPEREVLNLLAELGSRFDAASLNEIEMVLRTGVAPDHISFGNTIKKERDIARAYDLGLSLYAVDCIEEVEKIARAAPGSRVFCRILTNGHGAEWPLSRKFGCVPDMAIDVLRHAAQLGLQAYGVSFHVGSQQTDLNAWDDALADTARVFAALARENIQLEMVNLGGGFPTRYVKDVPSAASYGQAIFDSLSRHTCHAPLLNLAAPWSAMPELSAPKWC